MMRYVLLAALVGFANVVAAFHVIIHPHHQRTARRPTETADATTTTALHLAMAVYPKHEFERAVECASDCELCQGDELNRLADLLESFDGCLVEGDDCEQERIDRKDVAEILRAIAALQLRQVYLENVNLFKERVEELKDQAGLSPVLETMVRAVECASKPGLCKDYELDRLADELEAYKGCFVDDDCEQEMIDRQDVADILRMQSALQLRQVYLENVNLFKERVDEARGT